MGNGQVKDIWISLKQNILAAGVWLNGGRCNARAILNMTSHNGCYDLENEYEIQHFPYLMENKTAIARR